MASETQQSDSKKENFFQDAQEKARPVQTFFQKFSNDWSMTFAGALAYSLLTAMLPIAVALVAILGFILGNIFGNQANSTAFLDQLSNIPGFSTNQGQKDLIESVGNQLSKSAGYLAIISVALAVFGGSRLFIAIENTMDIIYRVRPRPVIQQNLVAIFMTLIFVLLVPIMVFAATLPTIILNILANNPALKVIPFFSALASNALTVQIGGYLGGLLAAFLLFEAIYVIVPNQRISWKSSWKGAIVAAFLLELFIILFPLYISNFMNNYAGQVGFAVILLAFFYYFAVILLLGAEVNAFFFEKVKPLPNDLATFVSTMAGELNKDRPALEGEKRVDSRPTEMADKAHIADARSQERKNTTENAHKQQTITARFRSKDKSQVEKPATKKLKPTLFEVALGSAVALVVAIFQWRQKN